MPFNPPPSSSAAGNGGFQDRRGRPDERRRFKRDADADARPRVALTDFDRQLFALLDQYRLLDSNHIFHEVHRWPVPADPRRGSDGRSRRVVLARLQKLFHAGYIDRPPQQLSRRYAGRLHSAHFVYALGSLGHREIYGDRRRGEGEALKNRNIQARYIEHRLGLGTVLLAMKHAAEEERLSFEWMDGEDFRDTYGIRHVPVKDRSRRKRRDGTVETVESEYTLPFNPDAFVKLAGNHYFVEYDGGTEPLVRRTWERTSILRKLRAYWAFVEADLHRRTEIQGFQVLFITGPRRQGEGATGEDRLQGMVDVCRQYRPTRQFLFTMVSAVTLERPRDVLRGALWWSPKVGDAAPVPLLEELV